MEFNSENNLLPENDLKDYSEKLKPFLKNLQKVVETSHYSKPESSLNLLDDTNLHQSVSDLKERKVTENLKYIIVVGIGGSNLGTKAVYNALIGFYNHLDHKTPEIIFADTTDPKYLHKLETFLKHKDFQSDEVLTFIASKSGKTTETIFNFGIVQNALGNGFESTVVCTEKDSPLYVKAQKHSIPTLTIPKKVGGRFSVFSAVSLFPLSAAGLDVKSLVAGAKLMRNRCLSDDFKNNPALLSAVSTFGHYKKGIKINDNFFFNPDLEDLGKWQRQLTAESLGKKQDLEGNKIHAGVTPTVSIGTTDLHSMAQLYMGGPRDKFTTFVYAGNKFDVAAKEDFPFTGIVENLDSKSASEVKEAIYSGVLESYIELNLPFVEILLESIDEKSLGKYMQFRMIETMFLAKLINVNAFNQPNVELYKEKTREILSS